ncbi:MAG: hypothetical protein DRI48_01510 [Chloroflexi bacterium]|nr:MAG: hypothetical protein DRI48_01510 [Chloroflexota bacterium]
MTEGAYQLPEFPPRIAPLQGQETLPEGAMVVVGGDSLTPIGDGTYSLRVARQNRPGAEAEVQFVGRQLPEGVPLTQVRWTWIVYPAQPTVSSQPEPIEPLLIVLNVENGNTRIWEERLQTGDAWVYGIDSPGGIGRFIGASFPHTVRAILVRGTWTRGDEGWLLQVTEEGHYRFDPEADAYIRRIR